VRAADVNAVGPTNHAAEPAAVGRSNVHADADALAHDGGSDDIANTEPAPHGCSHAAAKQAADADANGDPNAATELASDAVTIGDSNSGADYAAADGCPNAAADYDEPTDARAHVATNADADDDAPTDSGSHAHPHHESDRVEDAHHEQ
jgi:hypothetical protein